MNQFNAIHILKESWQVAKEKLNSLLSVVGIIILFNLISSLLNTSISENSLQHGFIFNIASRLFLMGLSLGAIRIVLNIIHRTEVNITEIFGYFHKLVPYIISSFIFGIFVLCAVTPAILFLINAVGTDVFAPFLANDLYELTTLLNMKEFPIPDFDLGVLNGIIFLLLLVVPLSFVYLRLLFFDYFIIDKDTHPIDALKSSFYITQGSVGEMLKLILILAIINFIGALLMFVGLIFTIPVSMISLGLAYKTLLNQKI
jgi:uncharacterized membrane protein